MVRSHGTPAKVEIGRHFLGTMNAAGASSHWSIVGKGCFNAMVKVVVSGVWKPLTCFALPFRKSSTPWT